MKTNDVILLYSFYKSIVEQYAASVAKTNSERNTQDAVNYEGALTEARKALAVWHKKRGDNMKTNDVLLLLSFYESIAVQYAASVAKTNSERNTQDAVNYEGALTEARKALAVWNNRKENAHNEH